MSPERYLFTTSSLSEEIKVPVFETLKTVKSSFMNPQRLISKYVGVKYVGVRPYEVQLKKDKAGLKDL